MLRYGARVVLGFAGGLAALLLMVPFVAVLSVFWVVAGLTRALAHCLEPRYVPWEEIIEFDATIGWRPRAHVDAYYLTTVGDDVFRVRTDDDGWPGLGRLVDSDIVVFGDSYAFGYGVNAGAAFFDRSAPLRIKAIGAPGYNMVQELLLMQTLARQLMGKHVVWFVYLGNDLPENLLPSNFNQYRMPFVREVGTGTDWEIVTHHLERTRWPFAAERIRDPSAWGRIIADLHRPSLLAERAFAACEFLIGEGRRTCDAVGARLTVVTIPDPVQLRPGDLAQLFATTPDPTACDPARPERRVAAICARIGVEFVAGTQVLRADDYKQGDPHWTEDGHRRIADLLSRVHAAPHAGVGNSVSGTATTPLA